MSDELRPVESFFVDEEIGVALPTGPAALPVYGPDDRYGPEAGPDVPMTSVASYTGGPDFPYVDDPYGCGGACVGG